MTVPEAPKTPRRKDRLVGALLAGKYRIAQKIGEGGMGAVYIATQEPIDRKVAIKVLLGKLAEDDIAVKRFEQEARAISKMQHPNTVTIYDFGRTEDEDGERLYIVMEYLKGRTLTQVLRKDGNLVGPRASRIVRQVCASLSDAHAAGIIHRDLKPDNIFLTEVGGDRDWVKVLDFGVAKLADSESAGTLTQTGMIFGTPKYMSPEQAEGRPLDYRADIYAMGVVLYELLSGRPPFVADTPVGLLLKHIQEPPPPFSQLRPDLTIDPRLEAVVMKALEKDPDARYQEVSALAAELEGYERSVSGGYAAPTGTVPTPMASGLPTEVVGQGPAYTPANLRSPGEVPPDLSAGLGDGGAPSGSSTHAISDAQATQQAAGYWGDTAPQSAPGAIDVSEGVPPAAPRSKSTGVIVAGVALVAALGAFAFAQLRPDQPTEAVRTIALPESEPSAFEPSEAPPSSGEASPDPDPPAPADLDPEPESSAPDPAPAVVKARSQPRPAAPSAERSSPPEPATPARVELSFESDPARALVLYDGKQIGLTPFRLDFDRDAEVRLVFKKRGYETQVQTVQADEDKDVRVVLKKAPSKVQPTAPGPSPTDSDKVTDLK